MNNLKKYRKTLIGVLAGAVAGYAYYYYVGCASGSCAITSNPINSTAYGALVGALLLSFFEKETKSTATATPNQP